jgi:hypothetical protein
MGSGWKWPPELDRPVKDPRERIRLFKGNYYTASSEIHSYM